jgi:hypothetical protein
MQSDHFLDAMDQPPPTPPSRDVGTCLGARYWLTPLGWIVAAASEHEADEPVSP